MITSIVSIFLVVFTVLLLSSKISDGPCPVIQGASSLGLLKEHVAKPLTVILDNASTHTAKRIRPFVDLLKKQGLTLYFLPTYSPELNRIEKLWHKAKHTWMAVKCRNSQMLEADVSHILDNFGSAYKLDF